MASVGIRCGGSHPFIGYHRVRFGIDRSNPNFPPNQIAQFHRSLSISNHTVERRPQRISASTATATRRISNSPPCYDHLDSYKKIVNEEFEEVDNKEAVFRERLDEWMRDSVVEIVKNLREAPLFVQVYANKNGATRLETEKAIAENWPIVTRKWKDGEAPSPDGVILVEELEDKEGDFNGDTDTEEEEEENGTREWGIVIQGKGVECGPACYLLKTSKVGSGLGLFCTHFCLARVNSFRKSALSQLTDCWLLQ